MQKNGVFSLIWSFPHKSIVEIKKTSYSANESVLTNIYYKQQTKELNMTEIEKLKKAYEATENLTLDLTASLQDQAFTTGFNA